MAIHKLKKHQSDIPYTMVSRDVAQLITNPDSLAIWTYLQSLPDNWDISEKQLREHFSIGKTRYMAAMRMLRELNLYKVIHAKNEKNQFIGNYYHIYASPTVSESPKVRKPALPETVPSENSTYIKEKILLNRTIKDKENDITRFVEWWDAYAKKADRKKCLAVWKRRNLDSKADMLIADAFNRHANDAKWIAGYQSNPLTYLNGDKWEDELQPERQQNDNRSASQRGSDNLQQMCGANVYGDDDRQPLSGVSRDLGAKVVSIDGKPTQRQSNAQLVDKETSTNHTSSRLGSLGFLDS